MITSKSNAQVKNLNLLQKKSKVRDEQGVFIIEGLRMFNEAKAAKLLVKTYASETFYSEKLLEDKGYFADLDYEVISDSVFKDISETKTPQGIMGIVKKPTYTLDEIFKVENPFLLLLEDIRDPGNLGTIIRSAEGAGVTGIVLNSSCVDMFNPKVIRSTMGSIFRVPFYQSLDFIKSLEEVKRHGILIYAAHLEGKIYDAENGFIRSCGFLIGNEANGLSDTISDMADAKIKIPMEGKVESLNAAIAASILMYEVARQRRNHFMELK
ncbi:MAG TPA: RNA methyltransferase [Clostridiales bacterium]|nr:RNA methyltransferase [Clostridiales bacterium]